MYILLGLMIGFTAAIPLGPVNVFVISQTLKRDFFHGLMASLTTSALDIAYCLISVLGIFQIHANLLRFLPLLKVLASALLAAFAFRLLKQSREFMLPQNQDRLPGKSPKPVFGVVLLYVSNPILYVFWLGVGSTVTAHRWVQITGWSPVLFALACGLGGFIWYFLLVSYVSTHHGKIRPQTFKKALFILAVVLFGFSAYTFLSIFF